MTAVQLLKGRLFRVKALLRHRGVSREDAEDLVQEAALRLHSYVLVGGEIRDEQGFMSRTALNLLIDSRRRAHGNLYVEERVENLRLIDDGPTPHEILAAEERLHAMKDALDRVSVRTREIFFMHRLQGFSHAEIADKLKISKSAVEKHIACAVTTLMIERQRE